MSQTGPGQEAGSLDPSPEKVEWKPPIGILLLKLTYSRNNALITTEIGIMTEVKIVEGKQVFNFCRLATVFGTGKESSAGMRFFEDTTLNKDDKYSNPDGTVIKYKYPLRENDMILFVIGLKLYDRNKLKLALLTEQEIPYISDSNRNLLVASINIVNLATSDHSSRRH